MPVACVADKIISAPFVIGSIGVLAQIPKLPPGIEKNDIEFEQLTAGKYKRTLTMFGENTEEDREEFVEDLEDTFGLFKEFVALNLDIDIEAIATGETWFGQRALERQLVDELSTSDAYMQALLPEKDVFEVRYVPKKSWQEKFGMAAEAAAERTVMRLWQAGTTRRLP